MQKVMSKSELIQRIAERSSGSLKRDDVRQMLDALVEVGHAELKDSGTFVLPGFGDVRDADLDGANSLRLRCGRRLQLPKRSAQSRIQGQFGDITNPSLWTPGRRLLSLGARNRRDLVHLGAGMEEFRLPPLPSRKGRSSMTSGPAKSRTLKVPQMWL
jgi:hypothetical protein